MSTHIVVIDNRDSFVYNLVDAFAVAGFRCTVFRNTVSVADVLAAQPDVICLSPGPGHPHAAGNMMAIIDACLHRIPILGICLGFQALLSHYGATVEPCGPVHGVTDTMQLSTDPIATALFDGLTTDANPATHTSGMLVPVARYHSLGTTTTPTGIRTLGTASSAIGEVVMAAITDDATAIGLQFHPESILSPQGPVILQRCIELLQHGDLSPAQYH